MKTKINESDLNEISREDIMPSNYYVMFSSRVANAAHGFPGDVQKVVKEFFAQFKNRVNKPGFTFNNLMALAEKIEDKERGGLHGNPGFNRQRASDEWWGMNKGKFFENKKSVKLTESQLRSIVSESINRILSEVLAPSSGRYFVVYDNEWDKPFESITPVCVLRDSDINEEEGEICVNGEWDYVTSEFTNFYEDTGSQNAQPGDLVFDVLGTHVLYRRGLDAPAGCGSDMGCECLIGTKRELIDFALEYADEIEKSCGLDVRELFRG